jgi:hypothetical protein
MVILVRLVNGVMSYTCRTSLCSGTCSSHSAFLSAKVCYDERWLYEMFYYRQAEVVKSGTRRKKEERSNWEEESCARKGLKCNYVLNGEKKSTAMSWIKCLFVLCFVCCRSTLTQRAEKPGESYTVFTHRHRDLEARRSDVFRSPVSTGGRNPHKPSLRSGFSEGTFLHLARAPNPRPYTCTFLLL